ncbi:MAG: hypothetical protein CL927_04075 [Deltaproteobacteria bacterium]|nr:hypothetical protein [Deltaproteobacteria bacterium]HCH65645.1 hypothetical protein [Deltaproteobacteria bacterium]|tara:strand:+ start:79 stop:387 length:309 start_codon:yes stop_codon:yes gene_type:complete
MSRSSRTRRRQRKARRQAIRSGQRPAHRESLPLRPEEHVEVHGPIQWRDPRTRWTGLRARGGQTVSFRGTGLRFDVDFSTANPTEAFVDAVRSALAAAPTVD